MSICFTVSASLNVPNFESHFTFFNRYSLYRGLLPVLSSLYCSNFVYFYTFNGLKAAYVSKNSPETAMVDLLFGFVAGKNKFTAQLTCQFYIG